MGKIQVDISMLQVQHLNTNSVAIAWRRLGGNLGGSSWAQI